LNPSICGQSGVTIPAGTKAKIEFSVLAMAGASVPFDAPVEDDASKNMILAVPRQAAPGYNCRWPDFLPNVHPDSKTREARASNPPALLVNGGIKV
jgi:hypothetical protein